MAWDHIFFILIIIVICRYSSLLRRNVYVNVLVKCASKLSLWSKSLHWIRRMRWWWWCFHFLVSPWAWQLLIHCLSFRIFRMVIQMSRVFVIVTIVCTFVYLIVHAHTHIPLYTLHSFDIIRDFYVVVLFDFTFFFKREILLGFTQKFHIFVCHKKRTNERTNKHYNKRKQQNQKVFSLYLNYVGYAKQKVVSKQLKFVWEKRMYKTVKWNSVQCTGKWMNKSKDIAQRMKKKHTNKIQRRMEEKRTVKLRKNKSFFFFVAYIIITALYCVYCMHLFLYNFKNFILLFSTPANIMNFVTVSTKIFIRSVC